MKHHIFILLAIFALVLARSSLPAEPLGTAFNYEGRFEQDGIPANGTFHLQFSLWDGPGAMDKQIGTTQNATLTVAGGLFSVALDFGDSAFLGEGRWLQIAVQTDVALIPLTPRQRLMATPNALFAARAGVAQTATGLATVSKEALDLTVVDQRALRLEPALMSPNVVGGSAANEAAAGVHGATIGGGGYVTEGSAPVGGILVPNRVTDHFGAIAGGADSSRDQHDPGRLPRSRTQCRPEWTRLCAGGRRLWSHRTG